MTNANWIKLSLLALSFAVMLASCDQVVSFRLCDEYGAPLYTGKLNLDSGQVEVLVDQVRYGGRFGKGLAGAGGFDGNNMRGVLHGANGARLDCVISASPNGTGIGQCNGERSFRVKLRDLPHM